MIQGIKRLIEWEKQHGDRTWYVTTGHSSGDTLKIRLIQGDYDLTVEVSVLQIERGKLDVFWMQCEEAIEMFQAYLEIQFLNKQLASYQMQKGNK